MCSCMGKYLVADDANEESDTRADGVAESDRHRLEQQEAQTCDGHEEVEHALQRQKNQCVGVGILVRMHVY